MRRLFARLSLLVSALARRRLRSARDVPPAPIGPQGPPRRRRAKKPPYDLAKDASTDNQKYLM